MSMDSEAIPRETTSKSEKLGNNIIARYIPLFVSQIPCKLFADVDKFYEYCIYELVIN